MRLTTICYIEQDGNYLMLHRTKKENDQSHDKWLGVGGKFEKDESPDECILREVKEETGLTLTSYQLRGVMTFVSDIWETEYMFIYTADRFEGELTDFDFSFPIQSAHSPLKGRLTHVKVPLYQLR